MPGPVPDLVGRVVVRAAADTPAVRLEARSRVGRLHLRAPRGSPHEILIVRSLRLEDRGLDDQLARARLAAVPLDGRPVPEGAGAVVAVDLAQLLAQYSADRHDGHLVRHWWWQVVAGRLPQAPVSAVLATYPRESPHVVADLVRRGRADVFEAALPADVFDLLERVAREYAAPRLADALRRSAAMLGSSRAPGGSHDDAADCPLTACDLLVLVATRISVDAAVARSAEFARFVEVAVGLPERAGRGLGGSSWTHPTPRLADPSASEAATRGRSTDVPDRPTGQGLDTGHLDAAETSSLEEPSPAEARSGGAPDDEPDDEPGAGSPARVAAVAPGPQHADASPVVEVSEPVSIPVDSPGRTDAPSPSGLVTLLGGVFYLIHIGQDLAPPDRVVDAVGWWGVFDLLARRLVEDRPEFRDDELWAGLDVLGGAPLADRIDRLPAGTLDGWLDQTVPTLIRLLADVLDVDPGDLVDTLLVRPARVMWDRTHLDVGFPLSAASVAVRRAGLDRDPGWVPWLGHVVAFHFDDEQFVGGAS